MKESKRGKQIGGSDKADKHPHLGNMKHHGKGENVLGRSMGGKGMEGSKPKLSGKMC